MEWLKLRHTYDSLPQTENSDEKNLLRGYWWARYVRCARSTAILIFTNTIAVLALLYSVANHRTHELSWKEISTISPALEAVQYTLPQHYAAEFRQTNRWRAGPGEHSDEVDIAWHEIELGAGGIWISEEERIALNITGTPEHPLHRVPQEHGGGYLAMLEVFHLLHCLNSLRMGLYFNYERYKSLDDGVPDENIFTHFDHCIDMLRISIMCHADVTPALFYDPLENPRRRDALPNWSSLHTCRDFNAILDWNKHGPRSVRWRDAGANPSWDPTVNGADLPFPHEEDHGHHDHRV